jgi:hypothetical protein
MVLRRQLVAVVDPNYDGLLNYWNVRGVTQTVSFFVSKLPAPLLLEYYTVLGKFTTVGLHMLLKAFAGSTICTREPVVTADNLVNKL